MAYWEKSLNRRRILGYSIVGGVLAAAPAVLPREVGAEQSAATASPAAEPIATATAETMRALAIPGANVVVERPGQQTWTSAAGLADLQQKVPMNLAMHLRIGSITKTMTATIVLQLIDEGAMSLDDTLANLLPAIPNLPYADQITVRQLLSMTSGIFDLLHDESFFPRVISDPTAEWTPEEMIDIVVPHDPVFPPGTDFSYSNTNYILLGMIIERLTNHPIAAELDRRIFSPLRMAQTSLPSGSDLPVPFAHGYGFVPNLPNAEKATPTSAQATPDGPRDLTALNASVAWAAGGVVSTVGDLQIWLRALIDGSLISEVLQRERLTFRPVKRDPGHPPYGYGLGIANDNGLVGHDGDILGFHSFIGHLSETGASIIVLTNLSPSQSGADAANEIAHAIRDVLGSTPAASPIGTP